MPCSYGVLLDVIARDCTISSLTAGCSAAAAGNGQCWRFDLIENLSSEAQSLLPMIIETVYSLANLVSYMYCMTIVHSWAEG